MSRFEGDKLYAFIKGNTKDKKRVKYNTRRLSFVAEEPGYHVTHHIFRIPGGSLESFTEWQLMDYEIERVA